MFELDGKTALVTGGGSGIGEATARVLAAAGAYVCVGDRDSATAERVVRSLTDSGHQAKAAHLDVSDEASCSGCVGDLLRRTGAIDILVNNAGVGHVGTLAQTTTADLDRLYAVNVRGVFSMSKAVLPAMIARGVGSIVNLASIGGVVGIRERLAYCTTKFAVVGLTKSMALDHAIQGIRVNCVCPGRIETPFVTARLREYADADAAYREMVATQAVGRMGTPDEIAASVLYLVSDEAKFVTGSALIVDGGWSAGR